MKTDEIRSLFLNYFKKNGHSIVESSSLVPANDPTLLFTNAGMVQFKDVFLGRESRLYNRATSSQKCVRAGGKHNDLENVGMTARHHTFFEMLGNFSFGDYFKKEAIHYAWEFATKELQLSKDQLYVTVYNDDDEAAEIWHKQEGVPTDRIYRFGEKDNFWAMGDTGPCGPCSELFIDRGEKYAKGTAKQLMGTDNDRFIEFWNLVFMQFNRDASGKLSPLPKPSVDTGAGLERIAAILQGVDSNFDTDGFIPIIQKTEELSKVKYRPSEPLGPSFKVIADHSRAAAFLVGDGVLPSNEGRGYVLRRIIRRAIRHGKKLGFESPFLYQTASFVIDQMKDAYPDLADKKSFIEKAVFAEEELFFRTLERGLSLLDDEIKKAAKTKKLPGSAAFKLYDTYGFPIDLTRLICEEKNIQVDETGFEKSMEKQREESRKNWKGSGEEATAGAYHDILENLKKKKALPEFVGYTETSVKSTCTALLIRKGETLVQAEQVKLSPKETVYALFKKTPFYGESGGQVGDKGLIKGKGFEAKVVDVQKPLPELITIHLRAKSENQFIKVGDSVEQIVLSKERNLTARNHTATHLLHWALREVLGKHVKQAGSLVRPDLLRFDFTHFQPLTPDELEKIENMINEKIWEGSEVGTAVMKKDEAVKKGAIAFFGEKYGNEVRVISVGDFSTELCGGTHVGNSAEIHLFKIASESGIASGVRRITAYTSEGAFQYLRDQDRQLKNIRDQIRASSVEEIPGKIEKMMESERELRKKLDNFASQSLGSEIDEIIRAGKDIKGTKLFVSECSPSETGIKQLREISDRIRQKHADSVIVLGMKDPAQKKVYLLAATGKGAQGRANAGEIIKALSPLIGGKGGGKADMAQAGGTNPEGLKEALGKAESLLD